MKARATGERGKLGRVIGLCLLLLAVGACSAAPPPLAEAPREWIPETPTSDRLALARRLPWYTTAFVAARDPLTLGDTLGRRGLRQANRQAYESLVADLTHRFGVDLLRADGLREVGLDPEADAALAWLGPRERTFVLVATLRSEERFKTAIYRAAALTGARAEPEVVGQGLLIVLDGSLSFAVRGRSALCVWSDGDRSAGEVARELAALGGEESLYETPDYLYAAYRGAGTSDVTGYLNLRRLLFDRGGVDGRFGGETTGDAALELERVRSRALSAARRRGASVDELVAVDDTFRAEQESLADDPLRRAFGGLGGLVFGLDVDAAGARGSFKLWLRDRSRVSKLVGPAPAQPWLGALVDSRPVALVQTRLDLAVLADMLAPWLEQQGKLATIVTGAVRELAVAGLDGDVAWALTHPLELSPEPPFLDPAALGVHVVLGVKDADKAKALLDTLSELGVLTRSKSDAGYALTLPSGAALEIAVANGRLVASTDPGFAGKKPGLGATPYTLTSALRSVGAGAEPRGADLGFEVGAGALESVGPLAQLLEGDRPAFEPSPALRADPAHQKELAELASVEAEHASRKRAMVQRLAAEELARRKRFGRVALHVERLELGEAGSGLGGDLVYESGVPLPELVHAALGADAGLRWLDAELEALDGLRQRRDELISTLERATPP
ncbi:MAG: hypothetical protein HY908_06095 [Myxococcales bacterium]|nr:hypothetical protein [Myxococcales bacterium]